MNNQLPDPSELTVEELHDYHLRWQELDDLAQEAFYNRAWTAATSEQLCNVRVSEFEAFLKRRIDSNC